MVVTLLGAMAVTGLVVGVLAPAVAWLDRRQRARVTGRALSPRAGAAAPAVPGLLQPLADAVAWLARGDPLLAGAARAGARIAPAVSFVAALSLFAVLPFGGRYAVVARPVTLVVADPEWGLLLLVIAPAVAALGVALVGISGARVESQLAGIRAAAQGAAGVLALAASLLPMWVVYETLRPSAVGAWQDGVLPLAAILERVGVAVPAWLSPVVGLPAWGIVVNPPAAALFFVASMVVVGRPPFDSHSASHELAGGVAGELAGARRVMVAAAGHLWTLAFACAGVLLFLGAWSVPWLSQSTLVGWIAPFYGEGFAELVCAGVHLVAFAAKLWALLFATLFVRWSLPRWRADQVLALCLRVLVPVALVDAGLTAAMVSVVSGGPGA